MTAQSASAKEIHVFFHHGLHGLNGFSKLLIIN